MSNPFEIPDDLFNAMVASAVRQGIQPSMARNTKQSNPAVAQKTTPAEGAKAAKNIYDSYINVGFNEVQAFELLKLVLSK